ncbi:cytochrome P-450 cyp509A1, partial [Backusella circina FSU 941]
IVSFLLTLVIYKANKILRPPKHLRHIPHLSFIGVLFSLITKKGYKHFAKEKTIPMINSPESKGLYLKPGRHGWVINVSDPVALRTILMKHDFFPRKDITTGLENSLFLKFAGVHNMLLIGGERSKIQRKIAIPVFRRSMPVKLFGRLTQDLFHVIDSTGEIVNVLDLMYRFTLETIGLAGFGFEFNAILNKNSEWVVNFESVKNGTMDPFFYLFPAFDKKKYLWMFPKRKQIHKDTDKFLAMLDKVIENKRNEMKSGKIYSDVLDDNEKDILTFMIEAEETEGKMTDIELKSNMCLFFLAGHDTSAISLSSAIYYLAKHPDIQERARQSAIDILGDEPEDILPNCEQTKQMKYINQIIKETLRLSVPTPQGLPRLVTEDTVLAGVHIPKGSLVSPNMNDVHHNCKKWKNPFEFDPDRFDESKNSTKSAKEGLYWAPFLYGYRQCIGMDFAFHQQQVVLSMILRKYTFSLPENSIHKDGLVTEGTL